MEVSLACLCGNCFHDIAEFVGFDEALPVNWITKGELDFLELIQLQVYSNFRNFFSVGFEVC